MKTLVVRGTVDVSGSPTQSFPGTFAIIYSGEKYRLVCDLVSKNNYEKEGL